MSSEPYYNKDSETEFIKAEREAIEASRARLGGKDDWYGLALSGGGIRSAIFCLGALQALAKKNIMPSFDYMSSVSGGGYIASALNWAWRNDTSTGAAETTFPFGSNKEYRSSDDTKDARLAYLRAHGQYLIPDERLSIWSLTGVVIRTLFLNLAVWLPVGALAFVFAILLFRVIHLIPGKAEIPNLLSSFMAAKWQTECSGSCIWPYELFFEAALLAALGWMAGFACWAVAFSLDTRTSAQQEHDPTSKRRSIYGWIALASGALFVGIIITYFVLDRPDPNPFSFGATLLLLTISAIYSVRFRLQKKGREASANYRWRRTFEIRAGLALPWITILFALGTVPIVPYLLINKAGFAAKAAAGLLSLGSGLFAAVFGHRAQTDQTAPGDLTRWFLMVASAIFIYSIVVVAYVIAQFWFAPEFFSDKFLVQNGIRAVIMVSVVAALLMMWGTNTNYVGLHRFYRDRLMEAFMPAKQAVIDNKIDLSPNADRLLLTDLWPPVSTVADVKRDIPYPIVNTNGIFINDESRLLAWRGGDNFILSPKFVGSAATGWEDTARHMRKHGPLTLPSAMAASGAAMNANAAYVGSGVTRDRLVSIVLMLLNLRLGMWIGRPSGEDVPTEPTEPNQPNHWSPSFRYGMTRTGYKSTSPFVELSDGGHFDNSGIYELVRRKCSMIVAVDGEEDSSLALPALYSVAQRVREDFKANIKLEKALDELVPEKGPGYPGGISFVARPYFVAPIDYDKGKKGVLLYIKLSLAQGLGFDALGYRAQHSDFPHQPTADQFFVPEQVEAYRTVGYVNMELAIDELELKSGPFDIESVVAVSERKRKERIAASQTSGANAAAVVARGTGKAAPNRPPGAG